MTDLIERYNFVCAESAVRPNYDVSVRTTNIRLYFTPEEDVIIVGEFDNNYIYWLSVTKADDCEKNEQIFNRVSRAEYQFVSNESKAMRQAGLDYGALRHALGARLTRSENKKGEPVWETSFGHSYAVEACTGQFFASDVLSFVRNTQTQCAFREAKGAYKNVLRAYPEMIAPLDPLRYHSDIEPIHRLLAKEGCLVFSKDPEIRALYTQCLDMCNQKYNDYMSAMH